MYEYSGRTGDAEAVEIKAIRASGAISHAYQLLVLQIGHADKNGSTWDQSQASKLSYIYRFDRGHFQQTFYGDSCFKVKFVSIKTKSLYLVVSSSGAILCTISDSRSTDFSFPTCHPHEVIVAQNCALHRHGGPRPFDSEPTLAVTRTRQLTRGRKTCGPISRRSWRI